MLEATMEIKCDLCGNRRMYWINRFHPYLNDEQISIEDWFFERVRFEGWVVLDGDKRICCQACSNKTPADDEEMKDVS